VNEKLKLVLCVLVALLPGPLKKPIYRSLFNARIGAGVRLAFGAVLCCDEMALEDGARIGPLTLVRVAHLTLGKRTRIGAFTRINAHTVALGPSVTIGPQVSIMGDHRDRRSALSAGAETWIFEYCYINLSRSVKLGRNVGIGGGSYVFTHGLWLSKLDGYPIAFGEVTIGNDVWLPWACFIMPGVKIGDGAVVGARSVITKDVPPKALVAGSPAKIIREQVATPLAFEQKNDILLQAAREFAEACGAELTVEQQADHLALRLAGEVFAIIALDGAPPALRQVPPEVLCMLHSPYAMTASLHPRVISLCSYQSCSRQLLSERQLAWLNHLRLIGMRYYPRDEVVIEEPDADGDA
jgi:acetyltransferase-like isoleucine patch superfamily enzyme